VDLVDEENGVGVVDQLLEHPLEALFKVAAILGAGQQGTHVQRVDRGVGQDFRHAALDDAPRQAFGDGGLADAGLADQQRVVLAAAAQRLHHALEFLVAADQRVDLSGERLLVEVLGEVFQRTRLGVCRVGFLLAGFLALGRRLRRLGDAMGDEVDYVEARDVLPLQEVDGVGILLAEDGDQHVGAGDLLLAG